ncbi:MULTISPECIES: type II secretion system F family protein [Desulfococcus]|jgi:type IV pilus assembly protein PilC|uniref:Type II secretion system F domain-containing protein n=1 Tax=Desulfococcus multivorans DSM 2059 TaxID=1121405 RepID=S7VFP9_DESML|nr:type II secretion system F family protein [Desulfococcus multivorans]AOY58492.1 PilC: type 4 fimbrial assembly protein [Desulfococcus multivorans]AQV00807.1 pilus assembly protein PilC [Desulfococcus multivorans]EPR43278.1 Type II secretion system F domain-containing protein [Desulfococcus multivorans DSM 2059]MDX9817325.1 type II secretion system F family protein [Desulfococcus multivorans]SJZ41890.1 type IV pilus assembly protein PilC [Desulfococcus multivorans DSM 2059]
MAEYVWKAKNRRGFEQSGQIEAPSLETARSQLIKRGLNSIKVKEKPKDILENISFLQPKVTNKDIIVFCRQFSTMIDAGLPIIQCLELLSAQAENKTFVKILKAVKEDLAGGATLADALKKHPNEFNDLFVNMIAAGEAGGILDTILKRLSETLEKAERLKAKVKSAMLYPAITLFVAVAVVIVIMIFVIPVFQKMFGEMGQALPSLTMMVIRASEFTKDNILYMIIGAGLLGFTVKKYYGTEKGRRIIDRRLLGIPVIGGLIRKVAVAKFTRTMGTMLASGVAILDGLDIVARTAGNKIVETAIYDVRSSIKEGQTMAAPLAGSGVFPPMVCSMIAVGESTGALDTMMVKIADFYDEEVDEAVERLTEMIEPFMICFLGVVVGGVVIAMYLPIFSMASGIA